MILSCNSLISRHSARTIGCLLHLLQLFVRITQPLAGVLTFLAALLHSTEPLEQQTGFTAARDIAWASGGHIQRVQESFPRMLPFVQLPQVQCALFALLSLAPAGMLTLPWMLPLGKLAQQVTLYRCLIVQVRASARMLPSLELDE